ncbi:MAG: sulfatase-like hydrolase/transferase [Carboxylicivirga sp.]|jgi:arylsulfatase A-like enzyme|nr:sulfatase-like hydrolase/transferase [Carboxylicivirga sp.]
MKSKQLLVHSLMFLASVFCSLHAENRKEKQPNFVIILADDLGYGDLGCTGSKQIKTPHIDALADKGVLFTNGYVSSAVCSPSRAGLLTGINQVSFGFDNNIGGNQPGFDPDYLGLPLSQKTIATHLNELGYTTGLVGKWHLGDEAHFHPVKRGFDSWWGFLNGGHNYFRSEEGGQGYLKPVESNYKTPEPISYITDDIASECINFIHRNNKQPYFLLASFNAPHAPLQAKESDLKLYQHIKDKNRRTYAAMVHCLDVNVGRIMKAIEESGEAENTVVVFLSDNGGPCNSNASINAPYNGQKGILLEGGIRVPFIFYHPQLGSAINENLVVSSLDLAPTFIALANKEANLDKFTGRNLMPLFTNKSEKMDRELHWRFTISAAIRQGDWKLIRLPDRLPLLYNLKDDPSEQNNCFLDNRELGLQLLKKLGQWDIIQPHPVFLEGAQWRIKQLELYDEDYQLDQPR